MKRYLIIDTNNNKELALSAKKALELYCDNIGYRINIVAVLQE